MMTIGTRLYTYTCKPESILNLYFPDPFAESFRTLDIGIPAMDCDECNSY